VGTAGTTPIKLALVSCVPELGAVGLEGALLRVDLLLVAPVAVASSVRASVLAGDGSTELGVATALMPEKIRYRMASYERYGQLVSAPKRRPCLWRIEQARLLR
jgi:hypothetical protein